MKESLAEEYILVRYMGPKFAIVFSGIEMEAVTNFMQELKQKVEEIDVNSAKPKINTVLSTYYKGTALEGLTKKLEDYLDNSQKDENAINCL